ncbi:hypothetical protein KKB44_06635 [Candidatus Micrarchaeota archaeon]|nr:hypothetical protein [Candidatus Micrarchaeota archaeon]
MALQFNPDKIPLELRMKAATPREREQRMPFFRHILETCPPVSEIKTAICIAAYDAGCREFAMEYMPIIEELGRETQDMLVEAARTVCDAHGEVDLFAKYSTIPLTNAGFLYERDGQVLRVSFSDGKTAYCKSRNAHQEAIGLQLSGMLDLPAYRHALIDTWAILEGIEGRTLMEHAIRPEEDTPDVQTMGQELTKRILAITAFDYIFAMLDRNERGIIFGKDAKPAAIDHEYLLIDSGNPMQAINLLNYYIYLREMGVDPGLLQDSSLHENMEYAEQIFRLAKEKKEHITNALQRYAETRPIVDLTIFTSVFDARNIPVIVERIEGGVAQFVSAMLEGIRQVRKAGMFRNI